MACGPLIYLMMARSEKTLLEPWEITLVNAMLARRCYKDQKILAYLTRHAAVRAIKHARMQEVIFLGGLSRPKKRPDSQMLSHHRAAWLRQSVSEPLVLGIVQDDILDILA